MSVKRYDFDCYAFYDSARLSVNECEDGDYVLHSDYDALLAERGRLKEALAAMLEIHGVTKRYADTHIEIPQSWVDVSDFARAALSGESNAS